MVFWQLIIIQVITFGLLAFLLRQFLTQHVTQSQDRLQRLVQENRKREEELKEKRENMESEFKIKIVQHNGEMGRLKSVAEVDAQKMREEVLAKAEEEGKRIVADAEAQKEKMRNQLVMEMEKKALNLASDIIEHVFTAEVAKGIHTQLTDELIGEIERSDSQGLQFDVDGVEVLVPYSLTDAQMAKIKKIFSSKMGRSVDIKQTIQPDIMTGMVVRLGNSVLDGSLKNKLKGAMAHVRGSLAR